MTDPKHEINVLISIAKLDTSLKQHRTEMSKIPGKMDKIVKELSKVEQAEKNEIERFESLAKERRALEQTLEDHESQITKYKTQLMEVKTNKEYQAMLKEIETLKTDIDTKEERLLELMDDLDTHAEDHEKALESFAGVNQRLTKDKQELESRSNYLETEITKLEAEKPGFLKELDKSIERKYSRLLTNLGDLAVTNVEDSGCGGCHTRLPPQLIHEVKKNDHLITCEACGRILIYYSE